MLVRLLAWFAVVLVLEIGLEFKNAVFCLIGINVYFCFF